MGWHQDVTSEVSPSVWSLGLEVRSRLPKAGSRCGETAVALRGRETLVASSGRAKRWDCGCRLSLLRSSCSWRNGWSRGDIFKFANTTHLDVRHFSVAKESHQIKQPTFPLSFVKERFKKKKNNLAARGGTGSFASLRDWGMQWRCDWGWQGSDGRR